MKVKIKIVKNFSPLDRVKLNNLDIKIQVGWDSFELYQTDNRLSDIKEYFREEWEDVIQKNAVFSEKDKSEAKYLAIYASKNLGYAKPDTEKIVDTYQYPFDIYPYYKDVFEIKNTDKIYGLLKGEQIGSYQLKGEPKWGKDGLGSAHYIEDSFFVKPEIYETIFKPLNIKCSPVIDFRTKKELKTILQIHQQGISTSPLILNDKNIKEKIDIKNWEMEKYILNNEDFFPSFLHDQEYDFCYTKEYFGDGGYTQRTTVISKKLYNILKENKITGLNYYPMKNSV